MHPSTDTTRARPAAPSAPRAPTNGNLEVGSRDFSAGHPLPGPADRAAGALAWHGMRHG